MIKVTKTEKGSEVKLTGSVFEILDNFTDVTRSIIKGFVRNGVPFDDAEKMLKGAFILGEIKSMPESKTYHDEEKKAGFGNSS